MKRNRIMVVDDEEANLMLFRLALKRNPHADEVKTMLDGREALDYLYESRSHLNSSKVLPSLIIMDLKMPGMNGIEVIQKIKSEHTIDRIPIVIFTSSREEREITKSYEAGANSFIHKEIDFDTFCSQLEFIMEYWLVINRPPYS